MFSTKNKTKNDDLVITIISGGKKCYVEQQNKLINLV